MQQAVRKPLNGLPIKDQSLFREQCYVDGKWLDADSRKTLDVTNPATGEKLGTIPNMGAEETRRAIEAANAAWPAWRAKTAKERQGREESVAVNAPHLSGRRSLGC